MSRYHYDDEQQHACECNAHTVDDSVYGVQLSVERLGVECVRGESRGVGCTLCECEACEGDDEFENEEREKCSVGCGHVECMVCMHVSVLVVVGGLCELVEHGVLVECGHRSR